MLIISKLRTLQQVQPSSRYVVVSWFSSEVGPGRSVADRFSWLLAESHNSGVVDGLKKTYRSALSRQTENNYV